MPYRAHRSSLHRAASEELKLLLADDEILYNCPDKKQELLMSYAKACENCTSGGTVLVPIAAICETASSSLSSSNTSILFIPLIFSTFLKHFAISGRFPAYAHVNATLSYDVL